MSRLMHLLSRSFKFCTRDWLLVLLICAAIAGFAAQCAFLGSAKVDDAYITFSFSKNLALGNGPVYSHGVRVEGYSAFLWMVLVALPLVLTRGAAPLAAARIVGAPFILLLGWSVYRLARSFGVSRLAAGACVLLLSFSTDLAASYLTGMETLPYVALLTFAFAATAHSASEPKWEKWAAWSGLAVALMRIDGFVPWGVLVGWSLFRAIELGGRKQMGRFLATFAPPVMVYACWFVWRWHYYGMFLPSTYYAKALLPKLMPQQGMEYLGKEVTSMYLWFGLVGWLWLLWRRRAGAAFVGGFVLIHWAYVVRVGGDWMPFGRFVLPTLPLVVVLLVVASADAAGFVSRSRSRLRWLVLVASFALAGMMAIRMDHRFLNTDFETEILEGVAEQTLNVNSYLRASEFLSQVVPPGGRLVTDYGGVFAYYTDAAVIEMWGLANATIATRGDADGVHPIYGRTCPSCYPELRPEYFHVMLPLVRREPAFTTGDQVVANVWQSDTIGRYIDFHHSFAVGRARSPQTGEALYFLQKRNGTPPLIERITQRGLIIDYPFER